MIFLPDHDDNDNHDDYNDVAVVYQFCCGIASRDGHGRKEQGTYNI